jgi:KipI family sensor histidine kinase inhibitor
MKLLSSGDAAFSLELGDSIDLETCRHVRAFDRALRERPFPGLRETVPSYRALLVCFDSERTSGDAVREHLEGLAPREGPDSESRLHAIPTLYDGPDLEAVGASTGLPVSQVVALHASTEYTAYMLGFTPGFAYLGDVPAVLHTARRSTPRTRVAAGSVAIVGRQTGVYPSASAGGWNVIGRTSLTFFDAFREPPALLQPGDRVRFDPVTTLKAASPPVTNRWTAAPSLEVVEPGLLTTVQDLGRFGYRRVGVSWCGAADLVAHRAANAILGNDPTAATLECTVAGPALRFLATTRFAVTGADLGAVLHRADLGRWPVPSGTSVLARAGNVLAFEGRRSGCRAYVAVSSGIDVPLVLGSRATDLAGGFGGHQGRPLRAGDLLAVGHVGSLSATQRDPPRVEPDRQAVRVVLGPQQDRFTPEALETLLASSFEVAPTSDRTGCRLVGPRLAHRGGSELLSEGMVPGSIQVPPDEQPIVMLADCPTTGGYPKIATVVSGDLWRLAQLVPGQDRVSFRLLAS